MSPRRGNLLNGNTSSCGCLRKELTRERSITHGHRRGRLSTPEYMAWIGAKGRCDNESSDPYSRYGRRGINMCERWRGSYEAFLEDMGARPSPEHSIDRINVDGDYEPGNCRWANRIEQMRNTSRLIAIEFEGVTRPIAEWAEITGIKYSTIRSRVKKGWPAEKVLAEWRVS